MMAAKYPDNFGIPVPSPWLGSGGDLSALVLENELTSKIVEAGIRYWRSKRLSNDIPARQDFDPPIEVPQLICFMMLKDVRREPIDFRYRLVGTALRPHMKTDWTGRWMSDVACQRPPSLLWEYCKRVLNTGEPLFIRTRYDCAQQEALCAEAAMLPLAGDHQNVDMIMVFADFQQCEITAIPNACSPARAPYISER